jgi:hypothetical protein
MRRIAHRLSDERGQSLVLALLVLMVLAISLGSVIFFTAGNQRSSGYQKATQVATSLAEGGVNNAVSVLANPANANSLTLSWAVNGASLLPDNSAPHLAYSKTYSGGTVKWWGTFCDSVNTTPTACGTPAGSIPDWTWTLHSQATVTNPAHGSPIVKTMSAQVQVHQPKPGNIKVGVWNTIYSPFGPSSTCDTTVAQGVNMSVPLYVGGNLCLDNNAVIKAPVYAGGFLFTKNKQAGIGTQAAPIASKAQAGANPVHVGNYCQVQTAGTVLNPCKPEPTTPAGNSNVWVNMTGPWNPKILQANMPDFVDVTAPQICWAASTACTGDPVGGWYSAASPGPLHPCVTSSVVGPGTTTPPVFDNDKIFGPDQAMPGGSVPGTFNLTPDGASYTCKTGQGELSWNATTRTLTVNGTVFIDGSVYAKSSSSAPITYTGWGSCTSAVPCDGVVYVTGTVYITSVELCAVVNASNTDCNFSAGAWDPNKKILVFLAHYQGTQTGVAAGQGIVVGPTQTSFQGGLYADYQVNTGQGAATQGPLVSGTQTVVTGQQFQGAFPDINILPISIQGPPQDFYIDPPRNFTYGG